jgi:hypothetical protein
MNKCERVAVYVMVGNPRQQYTAPCRTATPPESIFRHGDFWELKAVLTSEDVAVPVAPTSTTVSQ